MNTVLLTVWDARFAPLAKLTMPRMAGYATVHGYAFHEEYIGFTGGYSEPERIARSQWHKIPLTIEHLKKGERVLWLDADQVVTNHDIAIEHAGLNSGFHVSKDWGRDATDLNHFSMCGYIANPDALPLFEWVEAHQEQYIGGAFPEQTPMREASLLPEFRDLVVVQPQRVFNAVPEAISPGNVVEPWRPGDWCAHLTMLKISERVEVFHQILAQL